MVRCLFHGSKNVLEKNCMKCWSHLHMNKEYKNLFPNNSRTLKVPKRKQCGKSSMKCISRSSLELMKQCRQKRISRVLRKYLFILFF